MKPDILDGATLVASRLTPLALAAVDARFSRAVTFAGHTIHAHRGFARVLRASESRIHAMMMPLPPRDLDMRAMATFDRDESGAWTLVDFIDAASDASREIPFRGLDLEREALAIRLDRRRPIPAVESAYTRLATLATESASPPGFAFFELGLAAAAHGAPHDAIAHLGRAIDLGCVEAPSALAVRARLHLAAGDLAAADADIATLAALPGPGANDDGDPFPERWLDLHVTFLRGLAGAAAHDDGDDTIKALERIEADAAACEIDVAPYRTVGPDGKITSMDLGNTVFLSSTLEPDLGRAKRSERCRRALAAIAARRMQHERALAWLETLDEGADHLLRGNVLRELGRHGDAVREIERASEAGVAEATALLLEIRRSRALLARPPAIVPLGDDFELDARVAHQKFGEGRVVDVEGTGRSARVTIELADGTTRTIPGHALRLVP